MTPELLSLAVKNKAKELGFHLVGIARDANPGDREFYNWWVDQGYGANMFYLRTQKKRRQSLQEILPGAKSVVVCALRFPGSLEDSTPSDLSTRAYGKVARYALHEDYHARIQPLLESLAEHLDSLAEIPPARKSLAYVDTGAIPERALAKAAGLGWIGKNSMLLHPEEGSYFWIGEVLTTANLQEDLPLSDHCGKCRRCLDACPTGAIFEELRAIDSRKCLSYWNIEHRGDIPKSFHKPMQNWLLGCDICQEVCPWTNHSLKHGRKEEGPAPAEWIPVEEILRMQQEEFTLRYKSRALSRTKLSGLQRNAKIILDNWQNQKEAKQ